MSRYSVFPQIAVSDLAVSRSFYEGALGLSAEGEQPGGSLFYVCGNGTRLHVYESPDNAGRTTGTVAQWAVDAIEAVIDELSARGVEFEHYDDPVKTDAKGIHDSGYGKVAWFRDPDGNTFALEQA